MARPSLLTAEREKIIVDAIRGGAWMNAAAGAAGICYDTLDDWVKKGKEAAARDDRGLKVDEKQERYLRFFRAFMRARAEAEQEAVGALRKLAYGYEVKRTTRRLNDKGQWEEIEVVRDFECDPQSLRFYMERSFRADWGRQDALKLSGSGDDGAIVVETTHADKSDADLFKARQQLVKRGARAVSAAAGVDEDE